MRDYEIQLLKQYISQLTEEEQEIIRLVLNALEEGISERALCNNLGMQRTTFQSRKYKIFKKIEKSFGQNAKKRAIQG